MDFDLELDYTALALTIGFEVLLVFMLFGIDSMDSIPRAIRLLAAVICLPVMYLLILMQVNK